MEWVLLFVMLMMYSDFSVKLKKLNNNYKANNSIDRKKDYSVLKNMIGKKVEIEDNENFIFDIKKEGTLRDFNETWVILEVRERKEKSLVYIRLKSIESISEINDKNDDF